MQVSSFTTYAQGLLNVLENQVGITASGGDDSQKVKFFQAVWDTGATATVITEKVVSECGLTESGKTELHGVLGSEITPTYLVDVFLPNKVRVREVTVAKALLTGDSDILVGMDIIGMGDFAVSSYQRKTSFSFRVPSSGRIDFLPLKAQPRVSPEIRNRMKVGRNDPCSCGSGKKYKKCCGRGGFN